MATRGKKEDEPEKGEGGEEVERPRARARTSEEPAGARSGPLGALSAGLEDIVPGLDILERELFLEQGARADIAAVDPSGRLHLVLLAQEDLDRAALDVLDTLAYLQAHLELLVRHFGERRVNPERAPRLLVVSPSADERLTERLSALKDAGVLVLGLRTIKGASGESTYLERLEPRGRAAPSATGVAVFLRSLPGKLEALGHELVDRMARLDEELEPAADATTIVWRLQGEVLCRVERIGDVLQASVAPRNEPLALADAGDLEKLVERALARLVRVLGLARPEKARGGLAGTAGPAGMGGRGEEEPILTPEEIQAFRE